MSDHHPPILSADDGTEASGPDRGGHRRTHRARRPGRIVIAVAAFFAGATFSGAGAVWASHQFSDVPNTNRFHADIDWMVDNDIAEGYDDGTFRPTAPVSRQAFAAFLHRYNSETEVVTHVRDPGPAFYFDVSVPCPAGKRPVGGGGHIGGNVYALSSSRPQGTSWELTYVSTDNASHDPSAVTAYAICAPA